VDVDRRANRPDPERFAPGGAAGPVVAPIASAADLALVLVGCSEAERRGAAVELLHVVPPRWSPIITGRAGLPPPRPAPGHGEREIEELRARALTLARLCEVRVQWTTVVGRPADVIERFCRDHHAALLVIGADRRQLSTHRLRPTLASVQRLSRRAGTPVHLVCRE